MALLPISMMLVGCDRLPFVVSAEESATRACEGRLRDSLTSPSSYHRIWSSFTKAGPMTKGELIEILEGNRERAAQAGNDGEAFATAFALKCMKAPKSGQCKGMQSFEEMPHPPTAFVLIEFEAANAFNAKLPGFYMCRMNIAESGDYKKSYVISGSTVPDVVGKQLKSQAEFTKSNAEN